jgi:hypothetical protein
MPVSRHVSASALDVTWLLRNPTFNKSFSSKNNAKDYILSFCYGSSYALLYTYSLLLLCINKSSRSCGSTSVATSYVYDTLII